MRWIRANVPALLHAAGAGAIAGAATYWVAGTPITKATVIGLLGAAGSRALGYVFNWAKTAMGV